MKSTNHTAWAYAKGTAVTLALVTGTATLMAVFATVGAQPIEFSQDLLDPPTQAQGQIPAA